MEGFLRTALLAVLVIAGFATPPVRAESPSSDSAPLLLPTSATVDAPSSPVLSATAPSCVEQQFEYGEPHKVVDAVGWVFGIPKKIILWDRRAVNHHVTSETEQNLSQYMNDNGMTATKVRINQYDPGGEWQRLGANKGVGAGWRYTVGAVDTLVYTVFPGRLFGADWYNPYTDSVYIYSDIPSIAQEQASYAKLVHERSNPGTYAALTSLPVVRLWPEKESKDDVLDYTAACGTPSQERDAIHAFYPEYGAQIGDELAQFVPGGFLLTAAGAGVGHAAAHLDASALKPTTPAIFSAEWPAEKPVEEVVPASFDR
jgi:hypothetical protein